MFVSSRKKVKKRNTNRLWRRFGISSDLFSIYFSFAHQFLQEKNKRLESEKKLESDRKNFDKLKLDFEARIDTFRNRNTDIEDELRREIATLQKLIETLREQVFYDSGVLIPFGPF